MLRPYTLSLMAVHNSGVTLITNLEFDHISLNVAVFPCRVRDLFVNPLRLLHGAPQVGQ